MWRYDRNNELKLKGKEMEMNEKNALMEEV